MNNNVSSRRWGVDVGGVRALSGTLLVGPTALLAAGAAWILLMGAVQLGTGMPELALLLAAFVLAFGLASRAPLAILTVFGFSLTTLPYFESGFSLGKQAPLYFAVAVLLGCIVGRAREFTTSARGKLASLVTPVALFSNLLFVSAVITTLRYSPAAARWLGDGLGVLSPAEYETAGATSIFLIRATAFVAGPLLALVVIQLGSGDERGEDERDWRTVTHWLLGGVLAGLALSLLVCLGQAYVPSFPIPSRDHRWPTGLMTNPGGLAILTTMLAPVCLALSWAKAEPAWIRLLAGTNLALAIACVGPLDSKTGQAGILLAPLIYGGVMLSRRIRGSGYRKLAVVGATGVVVILLVVLGVQVLAVAGVSDWEVFVQESSYGFRPSRLERMRQLALMFGEHPVAGTGVGTFTMLLPSFYERYGAPSGGPTVLEATNHLLHMAATGGTLGLAASLWLLVAFLLPPARGLDSRPGGGTREGLGAATFAGVLAYLLISNWQGETFYYVPVVAVFWILVGVAVCALARPAVASRVVAGPRLVYAITALGGVAGCFYL